MPNESEQAGSGVKAPVDHSADIAKLREDNKVLAAQAKAATEKADKASGMLQRMLGQLEQLANARAAAPAAPADTNSDDPIARLKELHDEDPIAAVNELFNMRMGPLMQQTLANQAGPNRDGAKQRAKDSGLSKYDAEVDEFMNAMPEDVRAKPGAYDAAYRYIAANHINEIVEERVTEAKERASRPEGASGAETAAAPKKAMEPMEKDIMKALGVTEDDWNKFKNTDEMPAPAEKPAEAANG